MGCTGESRRHECRPSTTTHTSPPHFSRSRGHRASPRRMRACCQPLHALSGAHCLLGTLVPFSVKGPTRWLPCQRNLECLTRNARLNTFLRMNLGLRCVYCSPQKDGQQMHCAQLRFILQHMLYGLIGVACASIAQIRSSSGSVVNVVSDTV
jgi:hypothetical protein